MNFKKKLITTTKTLSILSIFILSACTSKKFDAPMKLGGRWVPAKKLNLGHDVYMNNCMSCHGVYGDGMGPAAQGSLPLPRNFKSGDFKFANVEAGDLPRDVDLIHTIRYGLQGTPMLPWDLSDIQLDAVTQYIKTFSQRWKENEQPAENSPAIDFNNPEEKDPWIGKEKLAIQQGEKIYHGLAQCFTCHPSYVPFDEMNKASMDLTGNPMLKSSLREKLHLSTNLDSSYDTKVMPPDYTKSSIKTGGGLKELYVLLALGINGTAMPAWRGLLSTTGDATESNSNQWALSYYVKSLYELKFDRDKRMSFMRKLNSSRAND